MNKSIKQFFSQLSLQEFIRFAIVGFSNTFLDFLVYIGLTRLVSFFSHYYLIANLISFSLAATNSFFWNRNWTFKYREKDIGRQYLKFFIVSIIGLLINEGCLYLLVANFHLYDLLAKLFAIGVSLSWNFFINRFWTFRVIKLPDVYLGSQLQHRDKTQSEKRKII